MADALKDIAEEASPQDAVLPEVEENVAADESLLAEEDIGETIDAEIMEEDAQGEGESDVEVPTEYEDIYLNIQERLGEGEANKWLDSQVAEHVDPPPEIADNDPDLAIDERGQFNLVTSELHSTLQKVTNEYEGLRGNYNALAQEHQNIQESLQNEDKEYSEVSGRLAAITKDMAQIESRGDLLKNRYSTLTGEAKLVTQIDRIGQAAPFIQKNIYTYTDLVINGGVKTDEPIRNQIVKLKAYMGKGGAPQAKIPEDKAAKLKKLQTKISTRGGANGARQTVTRKGGRSQRLHPNPSIDAEMQNAYARIRGES